MFIAKISGARAPSAPRFIRLCSRVIKVQQEFVYENPKFDIGRDYAITVLLVDIVLELTIRKRE